MGMWARAREAVAAALRNLDGDSAMPAIGAVEWQEGSSVRGGGGGWLMNALGGGATKSSIVVTEASALRLPVVYACMNRIANPIGMVPVNIYERQGSGAVMVNDHPMSQRLGLRPNDRMSSRTLRKTTMLGALGWGNGWQEIERNGRGEAVGLWPLLADRTRKVRDGDGLVVRTRIDGREVQILDENVVHIMDQSHDGYMGMSPLSMAREAVGAGLAMEQFGAAFFANDAKSGGFLMHPGRLGAQAHQNLRAQPRPDGQRGVDLDPANPAARVERQGGLDNAHRVKVLEEGMKFISTTIPPEDAQFLGSREFNIAEIARIYDVPLILLQSHEKSTSWGTGIEQLMIGFVRQTIMPWVTAWEQELNWKLFTESERARGLYVKFNMKGLLRGDTAARAAFYKSLFEVGGFSPNKILELEEEEGIGAAGDQHFVPVNFQTLEQAAQPRPVIGGTVTAQEDA